ncbi:Xaa-Pro peptidase family protein [Phaeobacter gallaeciensis]|jgi:Xaa-Pro dipeptidase|uniref:M24 family metallopeptidase n=1 Tax=Phaeobacter gallaeciensis TaxID=60890 RepID=UPI00237FB4FB|nr:Xaa-Pro peptidase family protein [Phaeobacter gallaeciensis]MDE4305356.1 Xaa-Pro peptidase family protein [Phaeobacter gallaeciensis]MDE4309704.1 Xaa-Pro peptidase family protein [Phaeobacter gallaeciensis]MDE4313973.1 Xaa-Pro peptidase family protein [Phaeobacter gallaeciensis]MDE4318633.1 Xaa-Pro peptidase family protein [Phaeobacter gallaeciensis]MDE4322607.1 Xaa-Pro peptidase family protein [Phaeobacter gallaeciensis]
MTQLLADYRQLAAALKVEAIALVPGPNFMRALGHSFMSHERPFVLVIPAEGKPAAIVPNLELGSWEQVGFDGAVFDWRDQDGYAGAFAALAAHLPMTRLAVEGQVMRVFVHHALKQAMPDVEIIDAERQISGLRMIKTAADIAALEAAISLSERALHRVLEGVRVGQTEKEIESALIQALFAEGADDLAFTPIVAAGDNSARPHAHARADYKVQSGDALLFDFGGRKDGFCADITRTVFVGEVSEEGRAVYDTVLRANLAGLEVTRAGVTAHEIDDVVTGVLEASPYADRIRTKTGHGLGRDVHEAPYIMRGNHQELPAGTVYTNEPGLYGPGLFGVRIEDDVLITEDGCRTLTTFPKELMIVG